MNPQDFSVMRRAMIDSQLRTSGVTTPWIIAAMGSVARERFVPVDRMATAYMDRSIPLGEGRALNPPLATGLLLGEANISLEDIVLLVGGATGYVAALIAGRAASLTVLEESPSLAALARVNLGGLGHVTIVEGPLAEGVQQSAPYSLIIIDGAISVLPDAIVAQLADGGRIVTGMVDGAVRRLAIGHKIRDAVVLRAEADCEIAELPSFARPKEFVF
jgi:protein-L-isoaspartate(D-aspartate) O-methyltransferase